MRFSTEFIYSSVFSIIFSFCLAIAFSTISPWSFIDKSIELARSSTSPITLVISFSNPSTPIFIEETNSSLFSFKLDLPSFATSSISEAFESINFLIEASASSKPLYKDCTLSLVSKTSLSIAASTCSLISCIFNLPSFAISSISEAFESIKSLIKDSASSKLLYKDWALSLASETSFSIVEPICSFISSISNLPSFVIFSISETFRSIIFLIEASASSKPLYKDWALSLASKTSFSIAASICSLISCIFNLPSFAISSISEAFESNNFLIEASASSKPLYKDCVLSLASKTSFSILASICSLISCIFNLPSFAISSISKVLVSINFLIEASASSKPLYKDCALSLACKTSFSIVELICSFISSISNLP